MKMRNTKCLHTLLLTFGGLGAVQQAQACASEPYLSAICTMAWVSQDFRGFALAAGQEVSVSQYAALFSLLGSTYGGNGQTTFKLPDLRGRVVVGAGASPTLGNFAVGQAGGEVSHVLALSEMPAHNHPVVLTVGIGTLAATTTLSGLSGTVNGSSFSLKGSNGGTLSKDPSGRSLATVTGSVPIYSDAAPSVEMKAGSIGGSASLQFSGNPSTALTGAPSVTGNIGISGSSAAISLMQPYLVMNTFIAIEGLYPTRN